MDTKRLVIGDGMEHVIIYDSVLNARLIDANNGAGGSASLLEEALIRCDVVLVSQSVS